jgi:hypothetical protein
VSEQVFPFWAQVAAGTSQKQPTPSGSVHAAWVPPLELKQPSGLQHAAVGEQPWPASPHVDTGCVQMPSLQTSPPEEPFVQQSPSAEQPWPLAEHEPADVWHVPLVAPGGTSQRSPVQQSPSTVQLAACGWQTRQVPSSHWASQHSASLAQVAPLGAHVGVPQTPPSQLPEQHCASPLHVPPFWAQAPSPGAQ